MHKTSLALVALLSGASTLAEAADAQGPSDNGTLEEIVVTAQKRAERLIDVPSEITSVKAEELVQQNLQQVRDYFSRIPDLQYLGDRTYDLSLRGITTG